MFVIFSQIQSRADSLVQGLCSNRNGGSRPGEFLLKTLEEPPEQQREMPKCWKKSQPFVERSCRKHKLLVARALPAQIPSRPAATYLKTFVSHLQLSLCWCRVLPLLIPVTSVRLWNRLQALWLVSKYQSPRAGTPPQGTGKRGHIQWLLVIQLLKINTDLTNF